MNNLVERIQEMPREAALEAAAFFGRELKEGASAGGAESDLLKPLTNQPFQHIEELEQLARLLLMTGASMPEYEDTVRKAVEGAGQKQLILGGAEIVAISVIALGALHVLVTRGRESEEEVVSIDETDGKATTTIKRTVKYGIGLKLGSILKDYFGSSSQPEKRSTSGEG